MESNGHHGQWQARTTPASRVTAADRQIRVAKNTSSLHRTMPDAGERNKSLYDVVEANLGGASEREVRKTLIFLMQWGLVERNTRKPTSVEEVADFWGESERTVFRGLQRFRTAFPGEQNPSRLALNWPQFLASGWRTLAEIEVPVQQ